MKKNKIFIQQPIWGKKSVGLAENKLADITIIDIIYRDKRGNRVFPETYFIRKERALLFPVQIIKGTRLRIIPICELMLSQ